MNAFRVQGTLQQRTDNWLIKFLSLEGNYGHTVLIWSQLEPQVTMKKEFVPALSIGITPSSTASVQDPQIWRILE